MNPLKTAIDTVISIDGLTERPSSATPKTPAPTIIWASCSPRTQTAEQRPNQRRRLIKTEKTVSAKRGLKYLGKFYILHYYQ